MKLQTFTSCATGVGVALFVLAASSGVTLASERMSAAAKQASGLAHEIMIKKTQLQSMTRDACFKMGGVESKDITQRTTTGADKMADKTNGTDTSITAGRSGLEVHGIDGQWDTLRAAVQQVSAKDYHSIAMGQVLFLEPIIQAELAAAYAIHAQGARTSQRSDKMLAKKMNVHKMIKEACFVAHDISALDNRRRVKLAISDFSKSLSGTQDYLEPHERALVQENWAPLEQVLTEIIAVERVSDATKAQLMGLSDSLIRELTRLKSRTVAEKIIPFTGLNG